jgi:hypothetical protein
MADKSYSISERQEGLIRDLCRGLTPQFPEIAKQCLDLLKQDEPLSKDHASVVIDALLEKNKEIKSNRTKLSFEEVLKARNI